MIEGFRLSPQQRHLWQLQGSDPDAVYRLWWRAEIHGPLGGAALRAALAEVVARHEILRTTFPLLAGLAEPLQVIEEGRGRLLDRVTDLSGLADAERSAQCDAFVASVVAGPFDLATGPLLRAGIACLAPSRHELVLAVPALCADRASGSLLLRELAELCAGRHGELPPAIQYADVAEVFNQLLEADGAQAGRDFWKRRATAPPDARLHAVRRASAAAVFQPLSHAVPFPPARVAGCTALAAGAGIGLGPLLEAAWRVLLRRAAAGKDPALAVRFSGRTEADLADAVGPLARYLPLPLVLDEDLSLGALGARIAAEERDLASWQDYFPWQEAAPPAFAFAYDEEIGGWDAGAARVVLAAQDGCDERFDLELRCSQRGGELRAELAYDASRIDPAAAGRFAAQLAHLVAAAVASPAAPVRDLDLLPACQRRQILAEWNSTAVTHARPSCLHQLFEAAALGRPDATAVICRGQEVTYRELDRRANQLAQRLRRDGVGPEVRVGLCIDRSPEMVVGLLGVLKAGGAYVPLDPEHPAERLAGMLREAAASLVLCQAEWLPRLASLGARLLAVDEERAALEQEPAAKPDELSTGDHLAYVIFTSGSTGRPKGVMVTHRAICNRLLWMDRVFPFAADDRVLHKTPLVFDASIWEVFSPLLAGAVLVLAEPGGHRDAAYLAREVAVSGITVLQLVPSMLRAFLDEPRPGTEAPTLRWLFAGGEALTADLRQGFHARSAARLVNLYGPTEAAIDAACLPCRPEGDAGGCAIGHPIDNVRIFLLDPTGRLVPVEVEGEIHIGGAGLARCYAGNPMLTAERFVPDAFSGEPGARLYRSGDLAFHHPDGSIEFLGRADQQVKIRGFRIELGEIESVLAGHPGVRAAAVLAMEVRPGAQGLVAYYVPSRGSVVSPRELRAFVAERLPDHMAPAVFVKLDTPPVTASGKLDRRALPAPDLARLDPAAAHVAPRDHKERALAAIWQEVLGVPRVGIHDNFFELGGESILSIQIVARARQAGLRVLPRQLFQHQTVAQLAAVATAAAGAGAGAPAVTGAVPLTPIQRLFFARALTEPHHFNQSLLLAARCALSPARVARTLDLLTAHHDALRLRFSRAGDAWQQAHAGGEPVRQFLHVDLAGVPAERRGSALEQAAAQVQSGFDLAHGPLLRGALFTGGDAWPDRLLLVAHHLVVDGVSWRILLQDLQSVYESLERGGEPRLPAKTSSFQQWAERLAAYARSPELAAELALWLSEPRGQVPPLPVDLAAELPTESTAASVVVSLEPAATQALLREVPPAYRTRIDDLLLAALAAAFAHWTGNGLLLVDLEGHGREEIFPDLDLSRTVGWFTSVHPVLLDVRGANGPGPLLKRVKEQLRGIPRHGIGYGLLRYLGDAEPAQALAALPRAEVAFNYLGQLDAALPATSPFIPARESAGPGASPRTVRSHPLEVVGEVAGGRLRLEWIYGERRHRRATIERLAASFLDELQALIAHCLSPQAGGRTPSDFPLAGLRQSQIDRIVGNGAEVEDLYPLTPLQQGLLFHSLEAPDQGIYLFQFTCRLRGDLDVPLFERAWREVVDRHTILRTGFVTDGLDEPLQRVHRQVQLPWLHLDWRGLPDEQRQARRADLLEAERQADLPFATPPLMRWTLIREEEQLWTFVWTNHHLILDGWSANLVSSEVLERYSAAVHGANLAGQQARPFRDYVEWLLRREAGGALGAEAYWRQMLAGFTAPTPLDRGERIDRSEPRLPGGYGLVSRPLPLPLMAELRAFARRRQLTLSTLVQAAWAVLLARYGDRRDVAYGLVVSGRPADLPGVESMVGVFINTLPARVEVSDDQAVGPWLAQLQQRLTELREHEATPLVAIQSWSQVPHSQPLFESILVFENYPAVRAERERDLKLEIEQASSVVRDSYPLSVSFGAEEAMAVEIRYQQGRFDAAGAARRLAHLESVLERLAQEGERRLGEISLLSAAAARQVLLAGRGPAIAGDFHAVHELFARQARQAPTAVALVEGDEVLRYGDLDAWTDRLARRLRRLGVAPEMRVALFVERSFEMVAAVLAVLKAGGAYVPLDPAYPTARVSGLLADANCSLVLTQERLAPRLGAVRQPIVLVGDEAAAAHDRTASDDLPAVDPAQLAYVIYTSGSTGRPKGVMVSHGGLWSYLAWCLAAYPAGPGLGSLLHSSLGFDLTVTSLFAPLVAGGWIEVVPESAGPGGLGTTLRQGRSRGLLKITPAHLDLLSHELTADGARAVGGLVIGGEQLHAEALARWRQLAPEAPVFNEYGPTETVVGCCVHRAPAGDCLAGPVPIGRPIAGAHLVVVDRGLRPVPPGMAGELLIGGAGVARGYHGQGAWTAERFIPDPFGDAAGARLYRTGDLVRLGPSGQLEFIARIDDQIKLRGFRIEPAEIEAVLVQHSQVREAAVVAQEDSRGERRLAAFLVPVAAAMVPRGVAAPGERPAAPLVQEVLNALRQELPAQLIPASLTIVEALPLTPHGKVDRRVLAAMDESSWQAPPGVAPRTPLEQEIAVIWQEVLGLSGIGVFESFFDLGGHSLRVMQVLARLRLRFAVDLPIARFVDSPTIAALAVMVATARAGDTDAGEVERILAELERLPEEQVDSAPRTEAT